jgi:hypothetical protein
MLVRFFFPRLFLLSTLAGLILDELYLQQQHRIAVVVFNLFFRLVILAPAMIAPLEGSILLVGVFYLISLFFF